MADRTAADLGGGLTGDEISDKVSVESEGQADVASIKATDPDPRFAATMANAFAENYIRFRRDADRRKVQQARTLVTADFNQLSPAAQQSSEGQSLQRQISRLSTLEALQTGNAELVQRATVPASPSSPKTVRNTALGWILGLLLGVAVAVLLERLDRRLRQPKDFEETFGLPVLSEVPENKALARSNNGMGELLATEGGAFQMLRTRLRYFNVDRDIHSVLVTSAAPGEGKTTVAWLLAASSAGSGSRTILLEADFHQPSVAARLAARTRPGLSELLSGQSSLPESLQQVTVENRQNGKTGMRHLDVIVAGSHPPNPVELLESDRMVRLLEDLSGDYDLVVIDSPPLPILADAIPLAKMVNGVIIVGRVNKTTRDEAQALHDATRKPGRAAPRSGGEQDFAWEGATTVTTTRADALHRLLRSPPAPARNQDSQILRTRSIVGLVDHVPSALAGVMRSDSILARATRPFLNRVVPAEAVVTIRSGAAKSLRLPIMPRTEKYYWTGTHEGHVQDAFGK